MSYPMTLTSQAQGDVLRERERQFYEEQWTDDHDDGHVRGELAAAAMGYATHAWIVARLLADGYPPEEIAAKDAEAPVPSFWPWDPEWWKPRDQRRDLVRAAALLIAEIERIDRAAAKAARQ